MTSFISIELVTDIYIYIGPAFSPSPAGETLSTATGTSSKPALPPPLLDSRKAAPVLPDSSSDEEKEN